MWNSTLVSRRIAHMICVLSMAVRKLSRVSWWYSWLPWEKLKRATFIPVFNNDSRIGTSRDFGPRVQIIFVFAISWIAPWSIVWMSSLVEVMMSRSGAQCARRQIGWRAENQVRSPPESFSADLFLSSYDSWDNPSCCQVICPFPAVSRESRYRIRFLWLHLHIKPEVRLHREFVCDRKGNRNLWISHGGRQANMRNIGRLLIEPRESDWMHANHLLHHQPSMQSSPSPGWLHLVEGGKRYMDFLYMYLLSNDSCRMWINRIAAVIPLFLLVRVAWY